MGAMVSVAVAKGGERNSKGGECRERPAKIEREAREVARLGLLSEEE